MSSAAESRPVHPDGPNVPDGPGSPDDPGKRLALSFEGFHAANARAWSRYAHLHLEERPLAEQVVESAFRHLARLWAHALRQANVEAYAWSVLKEHVAVFPHRPRFPLGGGTAFDAAVRQALRRSRRRLEVPDGAVLHTAMARLPERQYDAFVLHCVLGYSDQDVARLLGSHPPTVRSNVRWARKRIARELGSAGPGVRE